VSALPAARPQLNSLAAFQPDYIRNSNTQLGDELPEARRWGDNRPPLLERKREFLRTF
jgi:hypothetical protein